jgi:hypothetical protein
MNDLTLFDQPVPKLGTFHNTINLPVTEVKQRELRNDSQTRKILDFLRLHSYESFTPFEVQERMNLTNVPITSIRRALSDLTFMGYLVRTDEKRMGRYGENNYCWRLK